MGNRKPERAVYGAVQYLVPATISCGGKVANDTCATVHAAVLDSLYVMFNQMRNVKILLMFAGWRVHGYVWHDGRDDGKHGESLVFPNKQSNDCRE